MTVFTEGEGGTGIVRFRSTKRMQHPALAQVEGYWDALRQGRPVPFRSEVDPRGIDRALEYAFILERIAPGLARFRLAGMHLNSLMGMEVRGMPLSSFFVPDARRQVSDVLEHLFEEPAKVHISLTGESGMTRPPLSGHLMLLPLKSDLGDVSRALGCLVSVGEAGRAPRRFEVAETEINPLLSDPFQTAAPMRRETPGLAEDANPFVPASGTDRTEEAPDHDGTRPTLQSERPYLRLIHSND